MISDIGAISPGRWHSWQFFCKTGRTSLLNVTGEFEAARAAAPIRQPNIETWIILTTRASLGNLRRRVYHSQGEFGGQGVSQVHGGYFMRRMQDLETD
nr:hypothetical protein [uncultured bacterium]